MLDNRKEAERKQERDLKEEENFRGCWICRKWFHEYVCL